jgi:serine/threonine protein kinase
MEVLGTPDRHIVDKASRKKLFFGESHHLTVKRYVDEFSDATGAPRPFVNAKGKRRRPSTKTLSSVMKCDDDLFVDFISKCLTWDPEKRLKPQSALRHAWVISNRRRAPIAPTPSGSIRSTSRGLSEVSSGHQKERTTGGSKGLVISPPAPLSARQVPASTSRVAGAASSNRAPQAGQRNSSYTVSHTVISDHAVCLSWVSARWSQSKSRLIILLSYYTVIISHPVFNSLLISHLTFNVHGRTLRVHMLSTSWVAISRCLRVFWEDWMHHYSHPK